MATYHLLKYSGLTGVNDNDVILTSGDVSDYDQFTLQSTAGAMDVLVSLDGTNFSTVHLALLDQGSTTPTTAVLVTAANRTYSFAGNFALVRILQNGATAVANGCLLCRRRK